MHYFRIFPLYTFVVCPLFNNSTNITNISNNNDYGKSRCAILGTRQDFVKIWRHYKEEENEHIYVRKSNTYFFLRKILGQKYVC